MSTPTPPTAFPARAGMNRSPRSMIGSGSRVPARAVMNRLSPNDLFTHYKYWCSRNGHEALSIKELKRDLEYRFDFRQGRKNTQRFWADVELVSEHM